MNPRLRRLTSDYERIKTDFANHPNITVVPVGSDPPEKYHVTYLVNGIYLLPDGRIETVGKHEVEIELHSEYPRYKPLCKIQTPIFHPNFRDGQICIGDIWGAGESLSDIIINIGDMIQYKSWNSSSPLSSDAARWAIENQHLFPVGTLDLHPSEAEINPDSIEIDLFDDEDEEAVSDDTDTVAVAREKPASDSFQSVVNLTKESDGDDGNDFNIDKSELAGIVYVPQTQSAQQTTPYLSVQNDSGFSARTVFSKGIAWTLIGVVVGMLVVGGLSLLGGAFSTIMTGENLFMAALGVALIALFLGLFLGIGESVFYGSKQHIGRYITIGALVSFGLGLLFGYIGGVVFSSNGYGTDDISVTMLRGFSWALAGLGVGFAVGLIKPTTRRIVFCMIGGFVGGFVGGIVYEVIIKTTYDTTGNIVLPSVIGIIIAGILIGLGIGLLEQAAKTAWLKVIRGEFEGKEYIVFPGITSIGNTGKNTISLFKDRKVAPHHCDITLEGGNYVVRDAMTPGGTLVNGSRTDNAVLRHGDAISIGNTVLVFYAKKK